MFTEVDGSFSVNLWPLAQQWDHVPGPCIGGRNCRNDLVRQVSAPDLIQQGLSFWFIQVSDQRDLLWGAHVEIERAEQAAKPGRVALDGRSHQSQDTACPSLVVSIVGKESDP